MLKERVILLQILLVLFVVSAAFGQDVEVLKAELKGMEGRLDAKIDGVKNTLDAKITGTKDALDEKITGTKDALDESINGVKGEVVTIKWIIGIAGGVFVAFLGFVAHLLNHYVKKVLPNTLQPESTSTDQTQREPTSQDQDKFADNTEPNYQTAGSGS